MLKTVLLLNFVEAVTLLIILGFFGMHLKACLKSFVELSQKILV